MKRDSLLRTLYFALALLGLIVFVIVLTSLATRTSQANGVKTVIVELARDPVVVAQYRANLAGQSFDANAYKQQVLADQTNFLQRAATAGIAYTIAGVSAPNGSVTADIKFRFSYVYNGVTLVVPAAAIPTLQGMPGVKSVHEADEVTVTLDRAVNYVGAPQLYGSPARVGQFDQTGTPGYHGEGINVAVIDTGVDWTHPMFGGDPTPPQFGIGPAIAAAGPNRKVIYYLNLTAGTTSDDFGHGTHVAGDIAGYLAPAPTSSVDGIPYAGQTAMIHGVAPQAKIMAYKTLSAAGAGLNPSTILAIEDAVQPFTIDGFPKPVAHVINLSLGSAAPAGNNPDHPTAVACDNATLAGVTVVASAGNSGRPGSVTPDGESTIGSPGSGRRVLTVGANNDPGSSTNHIVMDRAFDSGGWPDLLDVLDPAGINPSQTGLVDTANKATAAGQRTNIDLKLAGGSAYIGNEVGQYYVYAGTVATTDPTVIPDSVAGRIAIARVGANTAFAAVANLLAAKGAAAALIIRPDLAKVTIVNSTIPTWSIKDTDANYLLDLLASGDNDAGDPAVGARSEFPIRLEPGSFRPAMADFSSKGPVGGFGQIKPDITAPGVNILSSTVRVGGVATSGATMFDPTGYISASGTSFSSPITAGVVALIKQKNITWTPAMIRAALINTATNLRQGDGTALADDVLSVNQQGGGLIDTIAAANAKALMGAGAPGPSGGTGARQFAIGVDPLVATSPGNPDFSASYSFGNVEVAGVIGASTHSQTVNIYDVTNGGGAGTYQLSASNSRLVDGTAVRVTFTDAGGNAISQVSVPANGSATFKVNLVVNGENLADASQIQWYVTATRNDGGQRLRMPFYLRATIPTVTAGTPSLSAGGAELAGAPPIDINGNYQLQFAAGAGTPPDKYRIQESTNDGESWTTLADVNASQTSYDINGRTNGNYLYRAIALVPVQNGLYPSAPSASQAITVDRRTEADVTAIVNAMIADGSISFSNGTAQFDQFLKNVSSDTTIYPPMRFTIVSVQSNSGTVRVTNADNQGDGVSSPAVYDYSSVAGFDVAPSESTATRHLTFSNSRQEMFTFTARVTAHLRDPGAGAPASGGSGAASGSGSAGSGGTTTSPSLPLSLPSQGKLLSFTVNPLTRSVLVKLK